jgi:FMN phosphatase YigB (HAD superfamily)
VISDAPSLQMWIRLCDMKLEHFFDFVIASEDEGELKPSPLPFKKAIGILKLKPEEIMMV